MIGIANATADASARSVRNCAAIACPDARRRRRRPPRDRPDSGSLTPEWIVVAIARALPRGVRMRLQRPSHLTIRPPPAFLIGFNIAGRQPVSEATMRAEAQKLSDDIEEAIALLRRSL